MILNHKDAIEYLRDVFIWAYERSAARYAIVRQTIGEPDPFRLLYRDALRVVVAEVVRTRMSRKKAVGYIASWAAENIVERDREAFRDTTETEVLALHEGNFARYAIRPSEFEAWCEVWNPR